ncbi:MAG: hypothetical protein AB7J47_24090 [Acidimicrobiia bacterium]
MRCVDDVDLHNELVESLGCGTVTFWSHARARGTALCPMVCDAIGAVSGQAERGSVFPIAERTQRQALRCHRRLELGTVVPDATVFTRHLGESVVLTDSAVCGDRDGH